MLALAIIKMSKQKKSNANLGFGISLAVSGAIIGYLFWQLDWQIFFAQLKRVQPIYLLGILVLEILCFYLRAIRWRYLLPTGLPVRTSSLFDALMIGFLGTFLLPLRAGEFIRPWVLSRTDNLPFSTCFASVVTERAFDVLALLALLGLSLSHIDVVPHWVSIGAQALAMVALAVTVLMLVSYLKPNLILGLGNKIISILLEKRSPELCEKLSRMLSEFITGLRAISSLYELLMVLVLSFVVWLEISMMYQVGMWAFGETPSLWVGIVINIMICLAVAAPSAPGFIGTFQAGCVAALTGIYGYSQEFSVAFSIVEHTVQMLAIFLVGFFCLNKLGLSVAQLRKQAAE